MPYTYDPSVPGGYRYDPNGTIGDTGNNPAPSQQIVDPRNPFNFNYGSGNSWAGYGDNQNNNPQWPGGTYDNTPYYSTNPVKNPDIMGGGGSMGNFDKFNPNPSLYSPDLPLNRYGNSDWMGALEPTGSGSVGGFNGMGSMGRNPNLNYTMGGGDVYSPDISSGWLGGNGELMPSNFDMTKLPGYAGTDPNDPGIPIDANGHEIPNPYGRVPPSTAGGASAGTPTASTLSPDIANYKPDAVNTADLLQKARDAAAAAAKANRPTSPGSGAVFDASQRYANLFGGFNPGWQQGFNELYNKQFSSGSDDFNRTFGSTQGAGQGNNFNWNIQPGLVTDNLLDGNFRAQAEAVARANPQIDFEPVMVDGKWYLASRAQDQSAQKSLLAPVLPPSGPAAGGGGSAGGARATYSGGGSSGNSKFVNYGSSGGGSSKAGTSPTFTQGQKNAANSLANAAGGIVGALKNLTPPVNANVPASSLIGPDGRPMYGGNTTAPANAPYVPVSGTGAGYVPMQPNLPTGPVNQPYVPVSGTGSGYVPMSPAPALGIGGGGAKVGPVVPPGNPGTSGYFPPSYPGSYDGELSPDGQYMWGAKGQYWYRR